MALGRMIWPFVDTMVVSGSDAGMAVLREDISKEDQQCRSCKRTDGDHPSARNGF
jgi:hypothetical protein